MNASAFTGFCTAVAGTVILSVALGLILRREARHAAARLPDTVTPPSVPTPSPASPARHITNQAEIPTHVTQGNPATVGVSPVQPAPVAQATGGAGGQSGEPGQVYRYPPISFTWMRRRGLGEMRTVIALQAMRRMVASGRAAPHVATCRCRWCQEWRAEK